MKQSRLFNVLILFNFLIISGCGLPGNLPAVITSNSIKIQKTSTCSPITINYKDSIIETENGTEKNCLCKAFAFRASQLVEQQRPGTIFKAHTIKSISTGWNSPDIPLFFSEKLGVDKSRFERSPESISGNGLTRKNAWIVFSFNDGTKIKIKAAEKLYSDRFISLRKSLQKGKKTLYLTEAMQERDKTEKNFTTLPVKDMFTVTVTQNKSGNIR